MLLLLLVAYPAAAGHLDRADCENLRLEIPNADKLKELDEKIITLENQLKDAVKDENEKYQTYRNKLARFNQLNTQVREKRGQLRDAEGDQRRQVLEDLEHLTLQRDEARRERDEAKVLWDEAKAKVTGIRTEINARRTEFKDLLKRGDKKLKDFANHCLISKPCVSGPGGQCR